MRPFTVSFLSSVLLACVLVAGCAELGVHVTADGRTGERYPPAREGRDRRGDENRNYFHEHGYTRLKIPPGHYPPPGGCRIWYPDRPPGLQPPPGRCSPVPAGAWVIRHPRDLRDRVHIEVYEPRAPRRIRVVGEFEIATGVFVRVVAGN